MFSDTPNIITVESVRQAEVHAYVNGNWVPARPLGFFGVVGRLKAAWLVFSGKADALIWEGQ